MMLVERFMMANAENCQVFLPEEAKLRHQAKIAEQIIP
jgi:hypothetical protein